MIRSWCSQHTRARRCCGDCTCRRGSCCRLVGVHGVACVIALQVHNGDRSNHARRTKMHRNTWRVTQTEGHTMPKSPSAFLHRDACSGDSLASAVFSILLCQLLAVLTCPGWTAESENCGPASKSDVSSCLASRHVALPAVDDNLHSELEVDRFNVCNLFCGP